MAQERFKKKYRDDFSGGTNYHFGPRQVDDDESPDAVNCDFKGKKGVGNRDGYTEIGTVTDSRTIIRGMGEYHSDTADQLIKFGDDGSDVELYKSTGGAWTGVAGTVFTTGLNMDTIQGGSLLYSANGTDAMSEYNGTAWATTTNGKIGLYPEYYNFRLWVRDATVKDKVWFSGQFDGDSEVAADKLGDFSDATAGWIRFNAGSGEEVKGMVSFKDYLYVLLENSIYRLSPASAADTFTVELMTSAVGTTSHRSVAVVGEDIFFAYTDGVYSLGDVANYIVIRTTNKSAKMQQIFDNLSGINKTKLVGEYFNFKYHLFYSLFGTDNDSAIVYDVRYKGWQDWQNMAANDATTCMLSDTDGMYFGEPTTGSIMQLYNGTDDNGVAIASHWTSKSFDEKAPDTMKLYFHHTFTFGALNGSVDITVIFDDNEVSATKTLTQVNPQGGLGRHTTGGPVTAALYGTLPKGGFGSCDQNKTVVDVINEPQRLKAKDKKFAVQYKITSSADWRLDNIAQWFQPFDHWKFPSSNKLN